MQKTNTKRKKLGMLSVLVITVMSFGVFMAAASIMSHNRLGTVLISQAEEGGDDEEEQDDEEKDDEEDKEKEKEKEKKEKEAEKAKKESEKSKEESEKSSSKSGSVKQEIDEEDDAEDNADEDGPEVEDEPEDETEDENELEDEQEDNGMFKDRSKTLLKLSKDIAEAEKEILEKQSEGVDVTAALARLTEAKAKIGSVNGAFDANDLEAAKDLSKTVKKLTHFAREEDLHDAKKIAEEVSKVAKRIAQVKKKLATLADLGGDTAAFESTLAGVEQTYAEARSLIAADINSLDGFVRLALAERQAKSLKNGVETALYALGGDDDEFDDDHKSEVAELSDDLDDVAELEGGSVGSQVRAVARAQRMSAEKVSALMQSVEGRSELAKLLIGSKTDDVEKIGNEVAANTVRISILNRAAEQVADADVKAMLLEQAAALQQETTKLQSFVSGQLGKTGLFGWIFDLF